MPKKLEFDSEARERLQEGVDQLTDAVAVTLGPKGRTVVLQRPMGPEITKDGVTVAREVELGDRTENLAVRMVKEVAERTADEAGDGTTTATVLSHAVFSEGLKSVASGMNPMGIKRGIDAAVSAVIDELRELSTSTASREAITDVATISANGDREVGEILADALESAGRDGVITVEEGTGLETELETVEGMRFDEGYLSHHFVTDDERRETVFNDPLILVTDEEISRMNALLPILEKVKEAGKPLLIIADGVEDEALATLALNAMRGTLQVCAVEAPGFGDRKTRTLEDIAVLTGAAFVSETVGLNLGSVTLEDLGSARRIVADEDTTTIVDGGGSEEAISERESEIRVSIERTESDYDREKLEERLARFAGGVSVIRVGAATETEMSEKKHRVEDALAATLAAVEEGIVPGGGVALLRARKVLEGLDGANESEERGIGILHTSLAEPTRRIAENAGAEGSLVVERILQADEGDGYGYDADLNEYGDLVEKGIIDPTKVVRTAVQNAASVASLLLTTESTVVDIPEETEGDGGPGGAPGAGGGMPGGGMGGGMPGGMGGGMPGGGMGGGLPGM